MLTALENDFPSDNIEVIWGWDGGCLRKCYEYEDGNEIVLLKPVLVIGFVQDDYYWKHLQL